MATTAVEVNIDSVVRALMVLEKRGDNLGGLMSRVALDLVTAVEEEFETEGRGRWAPLSPETIRQRRGNSSRILQDTGQLAGSIQPESGGGNTTDYFAKAFTNKKYARFHTEGKGRMKRDFTDIDLNKVLEDMADDALNEMVKF